MGYMIYATYCATALGFTGTIFFILRQIRIYHSFENIWESFLAEITSQAARGKRIAVDIHMPTQGITDPVFASFSPVMLRM